MLVRAGEGRKSTVKKGESDKVERSDTRFWDPNYVDPSWINQPIYLIPRRPESSKGLAA
jgi:hypothetical protein